MSEKIQKDVHPKTLQQLSWESGKAQASLQTVYDYCIGKAEDFIVWYIRKKKWIKRWARCLRMGAILAVSIAALIPLLAQVWVDEGTPVIAPAWASIVLVIGGALVGLDKFFGFSGGWIRFITTEMHLHQILEEFKFDWNLEKASWEGKEPDKDQVQRQLNLAKTFLMQVHQAVREEVKAWVVEFKSVLKLLDEAVRTKAEGTKLGGLNVTVTNGDACSKGWGLSIDGGGIRKHSGKTAAVRDLIPGIHTVRVEGLIGGKQKTEEKNVTVSAGSVGDVQVTLSGS